MRATQAIWIALLATAACGGGGTNTPIDAMPSPDAPAIDAPAIDAPAIDAPVDADPCGQCVASATCDPVAATCTCPAGFDGDGTTGGTGCADIDECSTGAATCVDAALGGACVNTDGGFTCACAVGFTGDGQAAGTGCADVDECAAAAVCDVSDCTNTPGGFACAQTMGPSPFQNVMFRLDRTTLTALDATAANLPNHASTATGLQPGDTLDGINAFTEHPLTHQIWGVLKVTGANPGRYLATLDPLVGAAPLGRELNWTVVGVLGGPAFRFASIAFLPDGSLYGVTGQGGTTPETLYQIDPATGAATLVSALGNGADGETLCYNADDGHMYHWSGNGTAIMEKFALTTPPPAALTIEPISAGLGTSEIFGCEYLGVISINSVDEQVFRLHNINSQTRFVTAAGVEVTAELGTFGNLGDDLRGVRTIAHQLYTVAPASGIVTGGTEVTLTGGALTGVTDVQFGGVAATVVDATSATQLIVTAPPGVAPGPVTITATIPAAGITVAWTGFEYTTTVAKLAPAPRSRAIRKAAAATVDRGARRFVRGKAR